MRTTFFFLLGLSLCVIGLNPAFAQRSKGKNSRPNQKISQKKSDAGSKSPFAQTQWWLGFRVGGNLTKATPSERFSVFSPTNLDPSLYEKEYESFSEVGAQAGVVFTYFHKGLSISAQPNFRRQRFTYTNEYIWTSPENAQNSLQLMYEQDHRLDYIEFPLYVRYDLLRKDLRPYVQVGFFYATLINAAKGLTITGNDFASGGGVPITSEEVLIGADDLFIKSSIGAIAGVGVSYDVGNIRLGLDVNYRYGFNNVTDRENRFSENQLNGAGDALDDIKLQNIAVSFNVLFPMRFLVSSNYRAVD